MANTIKIPASVGAALDKVQGTFTAAYSKPAGSDIATVFVASSGSGRALQSIAKDTATAQLQNGVLQVNLGAKASSRSAAGLAAEGVENAALTIEREAAGG